MLSTAWMLLAWLLLAPSPSCNAQKPSNAQSTTLVYRGDIRPPWAVRLEGGFHPTAPPDSESDIHYSLFHHVHEMDFGPFLSKLFQKPQSSRLSQYVSTTRDLSVAAHFTQLKLKGDYVETPPSEGDMVKGYIYHVQPTRNFIDSTKSLSRDHNMWTDENELVALGGIRWSQIRGWKVLRSVKPLETSEYEENPDYDPAFNQAVASGAVPQLAGFPVGHMAWSTEPYKAFRSQLCKDMALQFMESIRNEVNWRGRFPLMSRASSALALVEETQKAVDEASQALRNAINAPGGNLAACEMAVDKARRAAYGAVELMPQIVAIYNEHPYLPDTSFVRAWAQVTRAQIILTRARFEASINSGKSYREQMGKFRQLIGEKNTLLQSERHAAVIKAEDSIKLFNEMLREFRLRLDKSSEIIRVQQQQTIKLLSAEGLPSDAVMSDLPWIPKKENFRRGLERKLRGLESEHRALISAERAMFREVEPAQKDARAAWEVVNKAISKDLGGSSQASDSPVNMEELASEVLLEVIATVPMLAISAAGGPLGVVALGAHVYRSYRAMRILRWASRAAKAVKIGELLGSKASKTGPKLEELAARARSSMRSFKVRPKDTSPLKKTEETVPQTPDTSPPAHSVAQSTSQQKSLDDVLREVAEFEDTTSSPGASSVSAGAGASHVQESQGSAGVPQVARERTLEDLMQELESIKVPTHEPHVSSVKPAPKATKQRVPARFKREDKIASQDGSEEDLVVGTGSEQAAPFSSQDSSAAEAGGDEKTARCEETDSDLLDRNLDAIEALANPDQGESRLDHIRRELASLCNTSTRN